MFSRSFSSFRQNSGRGKKQGVKMGSFVKCKFVTRRSLNLYVLGVVARGQKVAAAAEQVV